MRIWKSGYLKRKDLRERAIINILQVVFTGNNSIKRRKDCPLALIPLWFWQWVRIISFEKYLVVFFKTGFPSNSRVDLARKLMPAERRRFARVKCRERNEDARSTECIKLNSWCKWLLFFLFLKADIIKAGKSNVHYQGKIFY